jgi:hypothetical protein
VCIWALHIIIVHYHTWNTHHKKTLSILHYFIFIFVPSNNPKSFDRHLIIMMEKILNEKSINHFTHSLFFSYIIFDYFFYIFLWYLFNQQPLINSFSFSLTHHWNNLGGTLKEEWISSKVKFLFFLLVGAGYVLSKNIKHYKKKKRKVRRIWWKIFGIPRS